MNGRSIVFLLLLPGGLAACFTGAPDEGIGPPVAMSERPLAMRVPGWLEFQDLSLHADAEGAVPREPYLRGWIIGGLFVPGGEVVGVLAEPPGDRHLVPGFLEVRTRAFIPESSDRPRQPPFVRGFRDRETGGFFPLSGLVNSEGATAARP